MVGVRYCPIVGGKCSKNEPEIRVEPDTFFLAEPFRPDEDRKRREQIVKIVLGEEMKDKFCERNLKIADKDPKDAIFCDVCRMIQSSSYGIVDISGLNPNVTLELGMMFALGKPVSVVFKKSEEESLKEKLPSDIVWKRVIPYVEFIDIHEELRKHIQNRPAVPLETFPAAEMKKIIAEKDPELAKLVERRLEEISRTTAGEFETLMQNAKLGGAMSNQRVEIDPSIEKKLDEIFEKTKKIEKLVGYPKDVETALLKGNWYFNKEDYEGAKDLYDWSLKLKPDDLDAWNNKGTALYGLDRYEEAIGCYDEAIKIKPDNSSVWSNKGNALAQLGKDDEAIKCYDEAIKIEPDNSAAWNNKGMSFVNLGSYDEAIKCFDEVIKMKPDNFTALSSKGVALAKLGKSDEAMKCCEEAIKMKPDNSSVWNNKGIALDDLGRCEEAIGCYDEAIKIKPDNSSAWNNKGNALGKLGRYDEAIKCYDETIKIKPYYTGAFVNLSETLIAAGKTKEGLESAARALAISKNPEDKSFSLFMSSLAHMLQGNIEEAKSEIAELEDHVRIIGRAATSASYDFSVVEKIIMEKLSGVD
jgi:tetratricopeptide (TPR) repeat protein